MLKVVILIGLLISETAVGAKTIDAQTILQKADAIRNPAKSYYMQVEVLAQSKRSLFDVFIQGSDKTLIKTLQPRRDRGRNLLMIKENMWAYIPNLHRAIRVGLAQKLSGQAANGDISRMRWSGDYTPKIITQSKQNWTLHLKAKKRGLTYDQLEVTIAKRTFRPLQAKFLTLTGKAMKLAKYENYQKREGKFRPLRIVITDALKKSRVTTINILKIKSKQFRNSLFNRQNLR